MVSSIASKGTGSTGHAQLRNASTLLPMASSQAGTARISINGERRGHDSICANMQTRSVLRWGRRPYRPLNVASMIGKTVSLRSAMRAAGAKSLSALKSVPLTASSMAPTFTWRPYARAQHLWHSSPLYQQRSALGSVSDSVSAILHLRFNQPLAHGRPCLAPVLLPFSTLPDSMQGPTLAKHKVALVAKPTSPPATFSPPPPYTYRLTTPSTERADATSSRQHRGLPPRRGELDISDQWWDAGKMP
ncbi:hypothetical protein PANT_3c00015 [Moesziomyces antarcticus T-34]|uniref:Uncharacterized protein n=1 Tax=Pseudozyma antarctica (strain T-34) TaxID=1151754 RepID=M9LX08_PSEA3|nr:hypothetical protein PANT_3c00015 [Moesziomyces antarcticus T-34]